MSTPPAGAAAAAWTRAGRVELATAGFPVVFGSRHACDPASPLQGIGGYSIEIPAEVRGRPYTLTGQAPNDLDIVWLRGPRGTSCVGLGYDGTSQAPVQRGTVPPAATWAFVVLHLGAHASFTLEVTAPTRTVRR